MILNKIHIPLSSSASFKEEEGKVLLKTYGDGCSSLIFFHLEKKYTLGPFIDEMKAKDYPSTLPSTNWEHTLYPILSSLFDVLWGEGNWTLEKSDLTLPSLDRMNLTYDDIKNIELRYDFENTILNYVKNGDMEQLEKISDSLHILNSVMEKRNPSAVRNIQNYSIIINTLLRKAAEESGVSPFLVDRISSYFGKKIESISTSFAVESLFKEMLVSYTRLIVKEKNKSYPESIRKVLFEIDSHYSEDLTLPYLSAVASLSPSHLSRLFHKTVGETIKGRLRRIRIESSLRLLMNPDLKISEISSSVGFQDPSYYSRVFLSLKGISPEEWRRKR